MKLYIKQKVFSWGDKFTVVDEQGNPRYYVQGEVLTLGKKLHVYDAQNNERIYIQQKLLSFLPRYYIFIDGQEVAEVTKEFTFFTPSYFVSGMGWNVSGDFFAHDYEVTSRSNPIARISKAWFTWGDSYVLDILHPADELPALAVMLAIDCAVAQQQSS